MYAVVKSGGKQYMVSPGDEFNVEKLAGSEGEEITLHDVLMLGDDKSSQVGSPILEKAVVTATIVSQFRDKKVIVFKKKRRQGYKRTKGHRQELTRIKIVDILADGAGKAKAAPKAAAKKDDAGAEKKDASKTKKATAKADAPKETAKKAAPKKAAAPKKTAAKSDASAKPKATKKAPAKKTEKAETK